MKRFNRVLRTIILGAALIPCRTAGIRSAAGLLICIVIIAGTGGLAFAQTNANRNISGYYVVVDGAVTGPYNTAGLRRLISAGQLTGDTLVWQEGLLDWFVASTAPELSPLFSQTLSSSAPNATSTGEKTPKNTITVDFGPTIIGAMFGAVGNLLSDTGLDSSGFGIAAQYERQLFSVLSVGGRFAYLGAGFVFSAEANSAEAELGMELASYSGEGHARFYPFRGAFFLDGMLGFSVISADFSGELVVDYNGYSQSESVSVSLTRNFLKYGAKLGWRVDAGKPGGFIFEPSFGYYAGIGLGDTLGKKLSDEFGGSVSVYNAVFRAIENYIFIGGPRVSLSFGWKF